MKILLLLIAIQAHAQIAGLTEDQLIAATGLNVAQFNKLTPEGNLPLYRDIDKWRHQKIVSERKLRAEAWRQWFEIKRMAESNGETVPEEARIKFLGLSHEEKKRTYYEIKNEYAQIERQRVQKQEEQARFDALKEQQEESRRELRAELKEAVDSYWAQKRELQDRIDKGAAAQAVIQYWQNYNNNLQQAYSQPAYQPIQYQQPTPTYHYEAPRMRSLDEILPPMKPNYRTQCTRSPLGTVECDTREY